jgi:SAM-dependent methyltransferase
MMADEAMLADLGRRLGEGAREALGRLPPAELRDLASRPELVRRYGDAAGGRFLLTWEMSAVERGERAIAEIERAAPIIWGGARVLDIGCNDGGFLVAFARRGAVAYGVDVGQRNVTAALRRAREWGVAAFPVCGSGCDLPPPLCVVRDGHVRRRARASAGPGTRASGDGARTGARRGIVALRPCSFQPEAYLGRPALRLFRGRRPSPRRRGMDGRPGGAPAAFPRGLRRGNATEFSLARAGPRGCRFPVGFRPSCPHAGSWHSSDAVEATRGSALAARPSGRGRATAGPLLCGAPSALTRGLQEGFLRMPADAWSPRSGVCGKIG